MAATYNPVSDTYSSRTPRTIVLYGAQDITLQEFPCATGATIYPGMLVEGTGVPRTLQPHSTSAGNARKAFALENDISGNDAIAYSVDSAYTAGMNVKSCNAEPGIVIYGFLAAGASVTAEQYLCSNGDGSLIAVPVNAATSQAQRAGIVGIARETINNSAGSSIVRMRVEII